MNLSKNVFKIISIICFVLPSFNCSNRLIILFDEGISEDMGIPLELSWVTKQYEVDPEDGGWRISNEGRKIRFEIEDSYNCGGINDQVQSGTATATITTTETYEFIPVIEGIGELMNKNYERMKIKLDNKTIVSSGSLGGGIKCKMGPVVMEENVSPPYILTPGVHKFELDFTTFDELYHVNAYYELNLIFIN